MNDPEKSIKKYVIERKHSISEKTRSQRSSELKQSPLSRGMKSLGKKYAQQNLFKNLKEHHQIVISEELVRNSKQYKSLRQKVIMGDQLWTKQQKQLINQKNKLLQLLAITRQRNYNSKLALWQLKNQAFELKQILNEQQIQTQRLQQELQRQQQQREQMEEEDDRQMELPEEEEEGIKQQGEENRWAPQQESQIDTIFQQFKENNGS